MKKIQLQLINNGKLAQQLPVPFSQLLDTKFPTIVFAVRRPGWVLCREEGYDLSNLHLSGSLGNSKLLGVVKEIAPCSGASTDEELGLGEFQTNYFNNYPVYLDESKSFFQFLGSRSLFRDLKISWNPFTIYRSFKNIGDRIKSKKLEGNYRGEGLILGGILVLSPDAEVLFSYYEETGSEIPKDSLINAINQFKVEL